MIHRRLKLDVPGEPFELVGEVGDRPEWQDADQAARAILDLLEASLYEDEFTGLLLLARENGLPIAGALNFIGGEALYGR